MFGVGPLTPGVRMPPPPPTDELETFEPLEDREGYFRENGMKDHEIKLLMLMPPITSRTCPACPVKPKGSLCNVAQHVLPCVAKRIPGQPPHVAFPRGDWSTRMRRMYEQEATCIGNDTSKQINKGKRRKEITDEASSLKTGRGIRRRP